MTRNDDQHDRIENEATDWLVLQTAGPLNPADALVFECWLQRSARHRAIYEDMRQTWESLASLQQQPGDLLRHTAALHAKAPVIQRRRRHWVASALAMAASLLIAALLASVWFGDPVTALIADHSSPPGEIRTVMLPDGSRADLGPSTAIRLHFKTNERRIELLHGSAYFTAVPQAAAGGLPFIVDTGSLSARALGTQFLVERLPRGDRVTVTEHTVEVTVDSDAAAWPTVLSSGQSLRYRRHGRPATMLASVDPQDVATWRKGNLIFDRMPLGEVVADLNQYRRNRIILADDALSARIVSGVFRVDEPDDALRVIAQELGLKVVTVPFFAFIYK